MSQLIVVPNVQLGARPLRGAAQLYFKPMLKIVRSANPVSVMFSLSGHIDLEHIDPLQTTMEVETLRIELDLQEVSRVDREVVPTLARWNSEGIQFLNCPAYLRDWIAKAGDQKDS
jgi:hypothetical protein